MFITNDIRYIGVNDTKIDLFEGQYKVPNGISYNSYVIMDDKIAVMDTVDQNFTHEWLDNLQNTLGARKPDYLIVQHMEPDHAANIVSFAKAYPDAVIVSSQKAFVMMQNFFGTDFADRQLVVGEGSTLSLGRHTLTFVTAPMVHWPEVIVTYDSTDKVLFSADGFGKFGIPGTDEPWEDEARRYYIGIVGRNLEGKFATLNLRKLRHGANRAPHLRWFEVCSRNHRAHRSITLVEVQRHGHHCGILHKSHHCGCCEHGHISRANKFCSITIVDNHHTLVL